MEVEHNSVQKGRGPPNPRDAYRKNSEYQLSRSASVPDLHLLEMVVDDLAQTVQRMTYVLELRGNKNIRKLE